ncbi:MAG: glycoside hydrolase domain-containing protein, partial [Candidatus Acidiferrales bacterium]
MPGLGKNAAWILTIFLCSFVLAVGRSPARTKVSLKPAAQNPESAYLGFDRNEYPGDAYLPALKQSFSFAGYWLNAAPGTKSNGWVGKRAMLRDNGFGFLVLFNGRISAELKRAADPAALAAADARNAIEIAKREGFSPGTVIFLDQEEGGRLLLEQQKYLLAWVDEIISAGFRAGVYCSGIPVKEGHAQSITTANDIHDHAGGRKIVYFVYNDVCPPSPGCASSKLPPLASASGIEFADAWQFAQSPRRKDFSRACPANYNRDGNCYPPPGNGAARIYLDLDS